MDEDGIENVLNAVRDWHRKNHEELLINACNEDVCAGISFDGASELGNI